MELHHKNHHNTYVNSFNDATEKLSAAQSKSDIAAQIALQPLINFHGGGHLNHTLFWENLAPKNQGGGEPPSGALKKAIDDTYGGLEAMQTKFNTALAGIQGSGWAWLVKDNQTGNIGIKTFAVSFTAEGSIPPSKGILLMLLSMCRTKILLSANIYHCLGLMPGNMLISMFLKSFCVSSY